MFGLHFNNMCYQLNFQKSPNLVTLITHIIQMGHPVMLLLDHDVLSLSFPSQAKLHVRPM